MRPKLKSEYHRKVYVIDRAMTNRLLLQVCAEDWLIWQPLSAVYLAAAQRNIIRRVMGGW